MENEKKIKTTTLLLALVAGFCDTATFVSASGTFSAHVTGNFIVFAAQAVRGADAYSWIKLLTFPVFMLAVMAGGLILSKQIERHRLLLAEGSLLLVAGTIPIFGKGQLLVNIVVMITVFAMGLQNTYGKIFPKETYGPTTMMTGNVTQLALDLRAVFGGKEDELNARQNLKKHVVLIGGFLLGCLLGGVLSKYFGLASLLLPAIIVINGYLVCSANDPDRNFS
jgi:uncharacterized membrane protein YoaK (UPF0700 family)